jgi:DNA-binding transcriptional MerR regulator
MADDIPILEDYIKKGLERGFNLNYIKDILTERGHSKVKVDTAANNVAGLKYPEKLKPHLEDVGAVRQPNYSWILTAFVVILILVVGFFTYNYFATRERVQHAESKLDEIKALGLSIDDLSETMKTQLELMKEKDLTIDEKEKIIEDQIKTIDEINTKIEEQRTKVNELILDIMNRMIGRMSG